jgi:phage terminase large subunit
LIQAPTGNADIDYGNLLNIFQDYYDNPVKFVADILGAVSYTGKLGPDPWQCDVLDAIASGERLVAVRAPHGIGKTTMCAFAIHWYLTTHYCCKIPIIAPTFGKQIKAMIFSEVHAWRRKSLLKDIYTPNQTKMGIVGADNIWFAEGVAADDAAKVEGFHAPGGILYVFDEAKGIAKGIWDAARGALTGPEDVMLAVSTPPLAPIGEFVRVFTQLRTTWKTFAFGPTPRQSKQWRKEREKEWPKSSPEYVSKVLGQIPKSSTDRTIIPLDLIEAAMNRQPRPEDLVGSTQIGMDVARYGQDETVQAFRHGKVILPLEIFSKQDTAISAKLLEEVMPGYDIAQVDEIAVGAGVVDPLSHHPELKDKLVPVKANDESPQPESYHDLGTWMWFQMVKWLEDGGILPYDDELCSQLATREFEWHFQHGRMSRKLVSKKNTAKNREQNKSPDRAVAVILAAIQAPRVVVAFLSDADMAENDKLRQQANAIRAALQPRRQQKEEYTKDDGPEQRRPDTFGLRSRREALTAKQSFGDERGNPLMGGFWKRGRR